MTIPRDRGEKYVAPQVLPGEASGLAWREDEPASDTVGVELMRRRLTREGAAHDLILKLDTAILRELSRSSR